MACPSILSFAQLSMRSLIRRQFRRKEWNHGSKNFGKAKGENMQWFKLHTKYIISTIKDELTPAERAAWIGFLCLANIDDLALGTFKYVDEASLGKLLNIPEVDIHSAIEKNIKAKRLRVDETEEGLVATVLNQDKYQPGQKEWREKKKAKEKKLENEMTERQEKKGLAAYLEKEQSGYPQTSSSSNISENETEEEKGDGKLPPIPQSIPFKIRDKLMNKRAGIREYKRLVTLTDDEIREKHRYLWTGCNEDELNSRVSHYREENEVSLERLKREYKQLVADYS